METDSRLEGKMQFKLESPELPWQFKVVETKLNEETSKLSKGQNAVKEHVESGNQKFEVRSNNDDLGINKEQIIHVDEYEIKYKHN